jgi:hypothetical protein
MHPDNAQCDEGSPDRAGSLKQHCAPLLLAWGTKDPASQEEAIPAIPPLLVHGFAWVREQINKTEGNLHKHSI